MGPVVLYFSYVLARETEQKFQVANFQIANYHLNDFANGTIVFGPKFRANRGANPLDFRLSWAEIDVFRNEAEKLKTIEEFNARTSDLNDRLGAFLGAVSGQPQSSDPKSWWEWWRNYSDTELIGGKQTVVVNEYEVAGNPYSRGINIVTCFAAGTPVYTDQGPVAIEKITVGDRVLSKDVESGELAYKPVLQTTVRPPKELTTLRLDDETIVCTGGHRFWNSRSGWVKARDIAPQTMLHTVTGNVPVWSAKKGETAETYNLVVADFHTYFVGKAGVLCQDLLPPPPTNSIVPGMSRANVMAPAKKSSRRPLLAGALD